MIVNFSAKQDESSSLHLVLCARHSGLKKQCGQLLVVGFGSVSDNCQEGSLGLQYSLSIGLEEFIMFHLSVSAFVYCRQHSGFHPSLFNLCRVQKTKEICGGDGKEEVLLGPAYQWLRLVYNENDSPGPQLLVIWLGYCCPLAGFWNLLESMKSAWLNWDHGSVLLPESSDHCLNEMMVCPRQWLGLQCL